MPSAVYRYFENRDVLLTALIVEAYDTLGDAAEEAAASVPRRSPHRRWVTTAAEVRRWATEHPHEYALLYGSPVPGYAAPADTIGPGSRVSRTLVQIAAEGHADGLLAPPTSERPTLSAITSSDLTQLAVGISVDLPPETLFAVALAWTQLFGLVSFELFGQTRNLVEHHESLFLDAAAAMAAHIGLCDSGG